MTKRTTVKDWLEQYLLVNGPTRFAIIAEEAKRQHVCASKKPLYRAASALGLPRGWIWRLPENVM